MPRRPRTSAPGPLLPEALRLALLAPSAALLLGAAAALSSPRCGRATMRMDTEVDGREGRNIRDLLRRSGSLSSKLGEGSVCDDAAARMMMMRRRRLEDNERNVRSAESRHGMPWTESVGEYTPPAFDLWDWTPAPDLGWSDGCGALGGGFGIDVAPRSLRQPRELSRDPSSSASPSSPLLFMPFWEWQMSFMKSELTDLRPLSTETPCGAIDVGHGHSRNSGARIVNHAYASREYRKIRMTYYDAGDKCQVYNSLWYPHPRYDLPVLGVDLLAFGRKRYLTVVDFQPIHSSEEEHAAPYEEECLRPIRDSHPSLQGRMTDRFYDSDRHFSSQMLYGRFDDESLVADDVWPAFRRAAAAHLDLVRRADPDESTVGIERVLRGQAAYDAYSARRDPAHALFRKVFGREWADGYVYGFLFDLSGGRDDDDDDEAEDGQ